MKLFRQPAELYLCAGDFAESPIWAAGWFEASIENVRLGCTSPGDNRRASNFPSGQIDPQVVKSANCYVPGLLKEEPGDEAPVSASGKSLSSNMLQNGVAR